MDIEKSREEINLINEQMLALFERRMQCAAEIAQYKKQNKMDIFDSARENKVLSAIGAKAGEETRLYAFDFFRSLMDISKEYQEKMIGAQPAEQLHPNIVKKISPQTIVYQGIEGSYSYEVCAASYPDAKKINVQNFEDVFRQLAEAKEGVYGILPIENSSTGSLFDIYEMLLKYKFYIVDEKILKVDHNLLAPRGATLSDLEQIYSHPQAFMQCSDFLATLEGVQCVPYYNTAISAKEVSEMNDKTKGAIAGRSAAALYHLQVLEENINNHKDNYTRFIIVSPRLEIAEAAAKVSVTFVVKHQSGALMRCLKSFHKKNLNLIKLESRPHPDKAWQYVFFADFEGNFTSENVSQIISDLKRETLSFDFLGNY